MKVLIQRVKQASVKVDEKQISKIDQGFLVFVGITHTDTQKEADYLAKKVTNLRVFGDQNEKMNLSLKDVNGKLLIVSQFTLYGNCENGNRPSFTDAARPDYAKDLYDYFCNKCAETGIEVQTGIFGADMKINLINDGPVTLMIEKN